MLNQLRSYSNGVHGEFFLKVAAEIERLREQIEITSDQQCPICCKSSPDDIKKIRDMEANLEFAYKRAKVLADMLEIPVHESAEVTGTILGMVRGKVERLSKQNSEMVTVLKDIYRITCMTSKASHREQTEIFQRMRRIIGVDAESV